MKINVTYACGHEGTVETYDVSRRGRERLEERESKKLCPECYKKELERENEENKRLAQEMGLPELTGTPKQVAYGNTCRMKIINSFGELSRTMEKWLVEGWANEEKRDILYGIMDYIKSVTEASWFINAQIATYDLMNFFSSFKANYPMRYREIVNNVKNPEQKMMQEELVRDGIIKPNKIKHSGIVKIQYDGDHQIRVMGVWNQDLKEMIRQLHDYMWSNNNQFYYRNIDNKSGAVSDRIAELGSCLLSAGYVVSVDDRAAYEKIKSGDYEPEWRRWVDIDNNGQLKIVFDYNDDEAYHIMRETLGKEVRKYDRQWAISPEHYMLIDELIKLHDFKITDAARSAIENARKSVDSAEIVQPILHTNMGNMQEHDGILDDLRDDDD